MDLKRFKVWIGPGPISILGLAHKGYWARPNTHDGPGPMIILDLKRFKVWIEPDPINILGQAQQSHWARLININGPDTLIILYAKKVPSVDWVWPNTHDGPCQIIILDLKRFKE